MRYFLFDTFHHVIVILVSTCCHRNAWMFLKHQIKLRLIWCQLVEFCTNIFAKQSIRNEREKTNADLEFDTRLGLKICAELVLCGAMKYQNNSLLLLYSITWPYGIIPNSLVYLYLYILIRMNKRRIFIRRIGEFLWCEHCSSKYILFCEKISIVSQFAEYK